MRRRERQEKSPSQSGNALVDDAAERLATIVAAAERAAEQVIDDAEERARQIIAQAEAEAGRLAAERRAGLDASADALATQAEAAQREAERLLEVVARTKAELAGVAPPPQRPEPASTIRPLHLSAVAPVAAEPEPARVPEPEPAPEPERRPSSAAGARLLATQMAVSGSSREEIETRLRNGFEIEDTNAILDAILGPED